MPSATPSLLARCCGLMLPAFVAACLMPPSAAGTPVAPRPLTWAETRGAASPFLRRALALVPSLPVHRIRYPKEGAWLTDENRALIEQIRGALASFEGEVLIQGFTDADGSAADNLAHARERIAAVREALAPALGPTHRVLAEAYGERFSVGRTDEEKAEERVVVVSLIDRKTVAALRAGFAAVETTLAGKSPQAAPVLTEPPTAPPPPPPPPTSPAPALEGRSLPARARSIAPRLGLSATYAPSGPAAHKALVYGGPVADGLGEHADDGDAPASRRGVALEGTLVVAPWLALSLGARYALYDAFRGTASFPPQEEGHEARTVTEATAMGVWIDALPLVERLGASGVVVFGGPGVDLDRSVVEVSERYVDGRAGGNDTFARAATSALVVVSARLTAGVGLALGPLDARLSLAGQMPLAAIARETKADAFAKEWEARLDHRAVVGTEIAIGVGYAF